MEELLKSNLSRAVLFCFAIFMVALVVVFHFFSSSTKFDALKISIPLSAIFCHVKFKRSKHPRILLRWLENNSEFVPFGEEGKLCK